MAGATHDAGGGRSLRGSAIFATDLTRSDATTNVELGLRLSATQRFEMDRFEGFERFDLPWRATVFAQASRRMFDAPDPEVDPGTTRRDVDARLGARLVAPIGLESAIAADVSYFERFSNLRNYDLDNLEFGLSFVRYF